jgi:hypothetical protein
MLMKFLLRAAFLALPFLATASLAQASCFPPVKIECGCNAYCNGYIGCHQFGPSAGPWFTYFPYNAYFQTPAPIGGWPYWPSATSAIPPHFTAPAAVRPAAFYGAPPSYWYERK